MAASGEQTSGERAGGKPARKRAAKRDLLFAEAAREINAMGAGGIVINDVAEQVGLSRNALYYYVADRTDLVFGAYQRACEAMTDDLVAADETSADPAVKLTAFVEAQLAYERPPQAVLSDVDFLPDAQRAVIREMQGRNVAILRGWLEAGAQSGAFRACDAEITAQSLLGMISWGRLSAGWLGYRDGRAARRRIAAAINGLMLHGFSTGPRDVPLCALDMEALTARSYNPFDRAQTNEVKIGQLIAAASRLFNQRGIDGASLDDIGAEVGATKGAVYHYFDDKADLVTRCYRRAFELFDLIMDTAVAQGRDGFERAMIALHLNVQAQAGPSSPLMLQPGRLALADHDRAAFERASQRLRMTSNRSLRQGMADGSVSPCDTVFVGQVSAGIFLWLPKWLPRDAAQSPRQIAEAVCDVVAYGLVPRT